MNENGYTTNKKNTRNNGQNLTWDGGQGMAKGNMRFE